MRALVLSALFGASAFACALPEAHKMPGGGGHGGDPGQGGGGMGAAGGGVETFGNAMWFKNGCAFATHRETMDLGFDTAAFTVEFWYRPNTLPLPGEYHVLVSKGGSNTSVPGWTIFLSTEGEAGTYMVFATAGTAAQGSVATEPGTIVAGESYHVVAWRKQSEAELWTLRPSLDQVIHVPSGDPNAGAVAGWVAEQPLALGALRRVVDSDCDFEYSADGVIDDVRIFSRQRTNTEFDGDFMLPTPSDSSELVAHWQMNEEQGNAMDDSVGAHLLTVSGTPVADYEWVHSPFPTGD